MGDASLNYFDALFRRAVCVSVHWEQCIQRAFPPDLKPARQLSTCNQWAGIPYCRHFRKRVKAYRIKLQLLQLWYPDDFTTTYPVYGKPCINDALDVAQNYKFTCCCGWNQTKIIKNNIILLHLLTRFSRETWLLDWGSVGRAGGRAGVKY